VAFCVRAGRGMVAVCDAIIRVVRRARWLGHAWRPHSAPAHTPRRRRPAGESDETCTAAVNNLSICSWRSVAPTKLCVIYRSLVLAYSSSSSSCRADCDGFCTVGLPPIVKHRASSRGGRR